MTVITPEKSNHDFSKKNIPNTTLLVTPDTFWKPRVGVFPLGDTRKWKAWDIQIFDLQYVQGDDSLQ